MMKRGFRYCVIDVMLVGVSAARAVCRRREGSAGRVNERVNRSPR
jgi:hypothetical protein